MGFFSGLKKVGKAIVSGVDKIINTFGELLGRVIGIPGFLVDLIKPWPPKKMRMRVLILNNEDGTPQVPPRDLVREARSAYDLAREVLKREANVKLISYGNIPRVEVLDVNPPTAALEPRCRGPFIDFFGEAETFYLAHKQFGISILLLGIGAPISAFVVREIENGDNVGCSPGAFADHCVVSLAGLSFVAVSEDDVQPSIGVSTRPTTTLVHELAHSSGLNYMLGSEHSDKENNLLHPSQDVRGTKLSKLQVATLRNSRFVTYL